MYHIGTLIPQRFIASEDAHFLSIAQDCFFVRVYIGRYGLYNLTKAPALTESHYIAGAFFI
jgi:hypothetical protein